MGSPRPGQGCDSVLVAELVTTGRRSDSPDRASCNTLLGDEKPLPYSLRDYDHRRLGPFLGVSDEGSAAEAILAAARDSPKARALGSQDPLVLGVGLDAERLGAVGETPVGPEEYDRIRRTCGDRLLVTTNVGTRVNPRVYLRPPTIFISGRNLTEAVANAVDKVDAACRPFARQRGRRPRRLDVYVGFARGSRRSAEQRLRALRALFRGLTRARYYQPTVHRIGLAAPISSGAEGRRDALRAIDLAKRCKLEDILILGRVRDRADGLLLPGVLQYLPIDQAQPVLTAAREQRIGVRVANGIDCETVARGIWTGLAVARGIGLHLGKYGTFPLSIEDCGEVAKLIKRWLPSWSTAPALFIDQPIVSADHIYSAKQRMQGIELWLQTMASQGVEIALIDTVEKSRGFRLLRGPQRRGLLSLAEVAKLDRLSGQLGIRLLWAGGISLPETFELGKLRPFGIYVTSATATTIPVTGSYTNDPMLPGLKEPTRKGVLRAKLMLEAGFLVASVRDRTLASELERCARAFIAALAAPAASGLARRERALRVTCERGWLTHCG